MVAIANALNYIIYNQLLLKYIYIYKKKNDTNNKN